MHQPFFLGAGLVVTKEIKIRFGPIRKTCDELRSQ